MQPTDDIALFVRTVDLRTFAAAAAEVNLTASAVARCVTRLEQRVGARLLQRSTRRLVLTPEGDAYLQHARTIVAAMAAAQAELANGRAQPSGLLRVNTGTAFARHRLAPHLPHFLADHPGISIDLSVSDRRIDALAEQIDVTIRVGALNNSDLVLHPLGTVRRIIVASPEYLARRGTPRSAADLQGHNCLLLSGFAAQAQWPFFENGKHVAVPVAGTVHADSADMLYELAVGGVGIVRLGDFLGEQALADGRLVPLLQDCHDETPAPLSALVLPGRQHTARVRAFLALLALLGKGAAQQATARVR